MLAREVIERGAERLSGYTGLDPGVVRRHMPPSVILNAGFYGLEAVYDRDTEKRLCKAHRQEVMALAGNCVEVPRSCESVLALHALLSTWPIAVLVARGVTCEVVDDVAPHLEKEGTLEKILWALDRVEDAAKLADSLSDTSRVAEYVYSQLPEAARRLGIRVETEGPDVYLSLPGAAKLKIEARELLRDRYAGIYLGPGCSEPEYRAKAILESAGMRVYTKAGEWVVYKVSDGMVEVLYPGREVYTSPEEFVESLPVPDPMLLPGIDWRKPEGLEARAGGAALAVKRNPAGIYDVFVERRGRKLFLGTAETRSEAIGEVVRAYLETGVDDLLGILEDLGYDRRALVVARRIKSCWKDLRPLQATPRAVSLWGTDFYVVTTREVEADWRRPGEFMVILGDAELPIAEVPFSKVPPGILERKGVRTSLGHEIPGAGTIFKCLGMPERLATKGEWVLFDYGEFRVAGLL